MEAKPHQVGPLAGIQAALAGGDAANARRISSGERNGFAKTQPRDPDYILERAIHAQCRAGQPRSTQQAHTSIGVQLDIHFAQFVLAWSTTGRHHCVGDQQGALQSFGAQGNLEK